MRNCHSGHRCNQRECATCQWRYSGRVARRILASVTGRLWAVEIDIGPCTVADFASWRVEAHNLIQYRRMTNRWWRDLSLWVWLCEDGRLRGILDLASVTPE